MSENLFADVDDTPQLIHQLVGAASTCWIGGTGDREFWTAEARKVASHALTRLNELKRDELVDFAVWLLQDEPGAGKEDKLVDNYLMKEGYCTCFSDEPGRTADCGIREHRTAAQKTRPNDE